MFLIQVNVRRSKLGGYLLAVAKVADAMDCEADERLLRENVFAKSPLHVRRTLDQDYLLAVDDTATRDRDQTVYRQTRGGRSVNARIVMVDQLWLWILDNNTIITSFPKRWGRNRPDPSKRLQELKGASSGISDWEIQSIYDLALIIVDGCFRVFFDRTRQPDQRPEVVDLFTSAIGNLHSNESFWQNMEFRSPFHSGGDNRDLSSMDIAREFSYLGINPEGSLFREAQDIAEKLQIMIGIYDQQFKVTGNFRSMLRQLNGKDRDDEHAATTL
ncbi:hypothetical protein BKA65DRAFT_416248 [Rhexocercosporidium sp. MPI-PUGE-AT-0058]|nr:hypothetical protein BKA65DRAFT_416248 [Rhexocercosporidium sp. MPI-PUGE-AT-0058]